MTVRHLAACLLAAIILPGAPLRAAEAGAPAPARTVVLAADLWCPVNCRMTDDLPGYAVELAREALARAGWQLEYRVMPWKRAVEATRAGRLDGVIGAVEADVPGFVIPREAIGRNANAFFVRADSTWRYRGIRSLDKVVVGVANEYRFDKLFDDYVSRHRDDRQRVVTLYSLDPVAQGLQMLRAGRIDTYVDDRMVVNWAIHRDPALAGIRESGKLGETLLHIAFSPARPDARATAEAFDHGMRALRDNGRLAAILARYGVADWAGLDP